VITKLTSSRSLSSLYRAVELFNFVIAEILAGTNGEAWAVLKTAEEFGSAILAAAEELLYRPETKGEPGRVLHEDMTRIQKFRVELGCLSREIAQPSWSLSTSNVERFVSLAGLIQEYLDLNNSRAGSGAALGIQRRSFITKLD